MCPCICPWRRCCVAELDARLGIGHWLPQDRSCAPFWAAAPTWTHHVRCPQSLRCAPGEQRVTPSVLALLQWRPAGALTLGSAVERPCAPLSRGTRHQWNPVHWAPACWHVAAHWALAQTCAQG